MKFTTLGHSNHSLTVFFEKLAAIDSASNPTTMLVDLRSFPGSRMFPQFNQRSFAGAVVNHGWQYQYLGKALGPRNDDEKAPLNRGEFCYQAVLDKPRYQTGIMQLEALGVDNVVLMSSKAEPLSCHRFLVVSRLLQARGHQVEHHNGTQILTTVELESLMITKYLNRVKRKTATAPPLMATEPELLASAYFSTAEKAAKEGLKNYGKMKQRMAR